MKRIKTLSAEFFWIEATAATIFFVLFILDLVHRDFLHALPCLTAVILMSSCVLALGVIRKEANKPQLTDHIEVPEKPLPTEVAALQELVRKYEQIVSLREQDCHRLNEEYNLRCDAEEEVRKKDIEIRELMRNNLEYLTERDNLYKELTALKSPKK
ncbi:MAG: hypothetical protein IKA00_04360 [Prevotella sp.]|nr:hypothetical protein [Bacteroidales bacterium]MBR2016521.1 hypothetical protein [Prevotella sp.]